MTAVPDDRPSQRLRLVNSRHKAHNDKLEPRYPEVRRARLLREARKAMAEGDLGGAMAIVIELLEAER
jgi:hypothetical protein